MHYKKWKEKKGVHFKQGKGKSTLEKNGKTDMGQSEERRLEPVYVWAQEGYSGLTSQAPTTNVELHDKYKKAIE